MLLPLVNFTRLPTFIHAASVSWHTNLRAKAGEHQAGYVGFANVWGDESHHLAHASTEHDYDNVITACGCYAWAIQNLVTMMAAVLNTQHQT